MAAALVFVVSWTAIRGRGKLPVADQATEKLVIRQIGHQLLLHAGDSTSRILPVEERGKREYLIRFAAPFTFLSDTLVAIVDRVVAANGLLSGYRVEVLQCGPQAEVIYGFQIFKDSARNIIPCLGRRQEKGCYSILIRFTETNTAGMSPFSSGLLAGSLSVILVCLLLRALYLKRRAARREGNMPAIMESAGIMMENQDSPTSQPHLSPEEAKKEEAAPSGIAIGNLLFLQESQQLVAGSSIIMLTSKEAKLLLVFAKNQQEVIDRDQLMKEVWEDEGVIVGRSLDMFVSKLRKKLQADPRISILNVHGKGYKLVISQMAC